MVLTRDQMIQMMKNPKIFESKFQEPIQEPVETNQLISPTGDRLTNVHIDKNGHLVFDSILNEE